MRWRSLVFVDHAAISVLSALVCVLTTDEGKAHRSRILFRWRGKGAANAASIPMLIGEAIPVDAGGFQTADKHSACPVGRSRDARLGRSNDAMERYVFCYFDLQAIDRRLVRRTEGPETKNGED